MYRHIYLSIYVSVGVGVTAYRFIFRMCVWMHFLLFYLSLRVLFATCMFVCLFCCFLQLLVSLWVSQESGPTFISKINLYLPSRSRMSSTDSHTPLLDRTEGKNGGKSMILLFNGHFNFTLICFIGHLHPAHCDHVITLLRLTSCTQLMHKHSRTLVEPKN